MGDNYLHNWLTLFSLYLFLLSMINNIKIYLFSYFIIHSFKYTESINIYSYIYLQEITLYIIIICQTKYVSIDIIYKLFTCIY